MRPMPRPYGHTVLLRRKRTVREGVGLGSEVRIVIEEIYIRRKGSRRSIERAARHVSGFECIISIDPYTRQEWLNVFGEGGM